MRDHYGSNQRPVRVIINVVMAPDFSAAGFVRRLQKRGVTGVFRFGAQSSAGKVTLVPLALRGSDDAVRAITQMLKVSKTPGGVEYRYILPDVELPSLPQRRASQNGTRSLHQMMLDERAPKRRKK